MKCWIGIDNGVTGSVAIIFDSGDARLFAMPVKREPNYTKKQSWVQRVNFTDLVAIFKNLGAEPVMCLLERPMVNPMRFVATASALRAMEATLIALEQEKIPYQIVDSKVWQKDLLQKDTPRHLLKEAAYAVAKRLFPRLDIPRLDLADGLLIAHYAKKTCI